VSLVASLNNNGIVLLSLMVKYFGVMMHITYTGYSKEEIIKTSANR
jgi:hypothetical protein